MKIRYLAYIAVVVTMAIWAGTAWSAPRKPTTHAYIVRTGDGGWWKVARAHGVTLQQLLAANHATAATPLKVGQTVQMPATAHEAGKAAKPAPKKPATPAAPASHAKR